MALPHSCWQRLSGVKLDLHSDTTTECCSPPKVMSEKTTWEDGALPCWPVMSLLSYAVLLDMRVCGFTPHPALGDLSFLVEVVCRRKSKEELVLSRQPAVTRPPLWCQWRPQLCWSYTYPALMKIPPTRYQQRLDGHRGSIHLAKCEEVLLFPQKNKCQRKIVKWQSTVLKQKCRNNQVATEITHHTKSKEDLKINLKLLIDVNTEMVEMLELSDKIF